MLLFSFWKWLDPFHNIHGNMLHSFKGAQSNYIWVEKEVRVVYENPKRKRRNDICATLSTCKERFKNRIRIQLNCNLLTYLLSATYNQDYICIVNTLIKLVAIIIPLCHGEIAPVNLSVKKGNRIKYSTLFFHHPPTKRRTCSPQRLYVPPVCVS